MSFYVIIMMMVMQNQSIGENGATGQNVIKIVVLEHGTDPEFLRTIHVSMKKLNVPKLNHVY